MVNQPYFVTALNSHLTKTTATAALAPRCDGVTRAIATVVLGQTLWPAEMWTNMKTGVQDTIQGSIHEVKGKIKEKVGQATNNPTLQARGKGENLAGKVQKKAGQIKRALDK